MQQVAAPIDEVRVAIQAAERGHLGRVVAEQLGGEASAEGLVEQADLDRERPPPAGDDDLIVDAVLAAREVGVVTDPARRGRGGVGVIGAPPARQQPVVLDEIFHRAPSPRELADLGDELRRARGEAEALLHWFSGLPVPVRPQPLELVALRHADEYPMNEGRIVSSDGLDVAAHEFDQAFEEHQVPHSTALHSRIRGRGAYLVGPLARVWLNRDRLSPTARAALDSLGPRFAQPDPAASVFARGIEVLEAIDEAIRVIDAYEPPPPPPGWSPRAATGHGATEAPRGLLYISVTSDARGDVEEIRIVPPTAQNQACIEQDLRGLVPSVLDRPHDETRRACESAIRDYDPCISCSVHFLDLTLERRSP